MIRCRFLLPSVLAVAFVGCATEPTRESPNTRLVRAPVPHLMPDSVYREISPLVESGASKSEQLEKVRSSLCIGVNPRISIRRTFTYSPPNTNGLAVDEALRWRSSHLDGARRFLKNEFFYYSGQSYNGVSQPENMEQPLSTDQLDDVDREAYERRNFVSGPQLVQRTYAARFLKPLYFREGGYADMQFLFLKFTFRIPFEVVSKFEKLNPTPHISLPEANHYFGYDREAFSPKLALEHQDFIWRWIAKNSTSIAEAAVENGGVRFAVEMKMDFFCRYAVPVEELRGH